MRLFKNKNRSDGYNTNALGESDHGPYPYVVDISKAAQQNKAFRRTIWTGQHLQVTLMSIPVGGEIGIEMHPHTDQFLRIEEGCGLVRTGERKDALKKGQRVLSGYAIVVPMGTWHNVLNTGKKPLKLYSIYAPPQHPKGTVHQTKADSDAAEHKY